MAEDKISLLSLGENNSSRKTVVYENYNYSSSHQTPDVEVTYQNVDSGQTVRAILTEFDEKANRLSSEESPQDSDATYDNVIPRLTTARVSFQDPKGSQVKGRNSTDSAYTTERDSTVSSTGEETSAASNACVKREESKSKTKGNTETLNRISTDSGYSSQKTSTCSRYCSEMTNTNRQKCEQKENMSKVRDTKQNQKDKETFTVDIEGGLYNLHLMNITLMFMKGNIRHPTDINVAKSSLSDMPPFRPGYQPVSDVLDIGPYDIVLQGVVTVKLPFVEGRKGAQNYTVMALVSESSSWKDFPADDDSEESYIFLGNSCFLSIEKFGKFAVFNKCKADGMHIDFENCNNNNGNDSEEDDHRGPVTQEWYAVLNVVRKKENQVKVTIRITQEVREEHIHKTLLNKYANNCGVFSSLMINEDVMRLVGETSNTEKMLTDQDINNGCQIEYVLEANKTEVWDLFTVEFREAERQTSCCFFNRILHGEAIIGSIKFKEDFYQELPLEETVAKEDYQRKQGQKSRYVKPPETQVHLRASGYVDMTADCKGVQGKNVTDEHDQNSTEESNPYEEFSQVLAANTISESEKDQEPEPTYINSWDVVRDTKPLMEISDPTPSHSKQLPHIKDKSDMKPDVFPCKGGIEDEVDGKAHVPTCMTYSWPKSCYVPDITPDEKCRRIIELCTQAEQVAQECCKLHMFSDTFVNYVTSKFTLLPILCNNNVLQHVEDRRKDEFKGNFTDKLLFRLLLMDSEFSIHLDVYKAMKVYTPHTSTGSSEADRFLLEIKKEKLRQLQPIFEKRMKDAKHLMGNLFTDLMVSLQEKQTLQSISTPEARAKHFLTEIILKSDHHVFQCFIKSLRKWHNNDLADMLNLGVDMSS